MRAKSTKTNPIGAGTANGSFNAPKPFQEIFNRLSFEMDVSKSELIREGIVLAIRERGMKPAAALLKSLADNAGKLGILAMGLFTMWLSSAGDLEARRVARIRPRLPRHRRLSAASRQGLFWGRA